MNRTRKVVWLILFLFGILSSFCNSNRKVTDGIQAVPVSSAIETTDTVPPVLDPEVVYPSGEREKRETLERVVSDAELLFETGKTFHDSGSYDRARLFFDECLDLLEISGFEFEEHPLIEHAYQSHLSSIRRLEMRIVFNHDEPEFPLLDELGTTESPLDVIANVNLYEIEIDPELESLVSKDLKKTQYDFPIVVNKQVLKFLDYYQGRGRKATEEALRRSGRYMGLFKKIFSEQEMPLDLIYMANVESLFKPSAYSRARARGIWQFMAGTGRMYGLEVGWWLDERLDFEKATESAGTAFKRP